MGDLVDYLRAKLDHATDPVCDCPDIDTTTFGERARGERSSVKGYDRDCPVHGLDGTEPIYRRAK